jgi:hypothetical protein
MTRNTLSIAGPETNIAFFQGEAASGIATHPQGLGVEANHVGVLGQEVASLTPEVSPRAALWREIAAFEDVNPLGDMQEGLDMDGRVSAHIDHFLAMPEQTYMAYLSSYADLPDHITRKRVSMHVFLSQ